MARYTTTVKTICESLIDPQQYSDYLTLDNIVDNAVPKIFDYTIGLKFPEADIEKQILIEYFNREIAFETVGYWKMKMRSLLIKNKEKYNNIYALFSKDNVNMFDDVDTVETREKTSSDNGTLSSTNTTTATNENTVSSESVDQYSETPQNGLAGVREGQYLTTADVKTDTGTNTTTGSTSSSSEQSSGNSGSENETTKRSGRSGGRIGAEIMEEYGKNMATLSSVILDDVAPLFLAIY